MAGEGPLPSRLPVRVNEFARNEEGSVRKGRPCQHDNLRERFPQVCRTPSVRRALGGAGNGRHAPAATRSGDRAVGTAIVMADLSALWAEVFPGPDGPGAPDPCGGNVMTTRRVWGTPLNYDIRLPK